MIELFPSSAAIRDGELELGGVAATELAARFGTPLVALCEQTLRERARAFRDAAPGRRSLLRDEGSPERRRAAGARRGRARRRRLEPRRARLRPRGRARRGPSRRAREQQVGRGAGRRGERGRPRSSWMRPARSSRAAAAGVGACSSASRPGSRRTPTPRSGPATTAPSSACRRTTRCGRVGDALEAGLDVAGLHVHVGSQLVSSPRTKPPPPLLAAFAARCRDELGWDARARRRRRRLRHPPRAGGARGRRPGARCGGSPPRSRAWRSHDLPGRGSIVRARPSAYRASPA